MLQGYRVFDADAHGMMTPRMWADLPANYVARRPRPVRISDDSGLSAYNNAWLIEGRIEPHPFGPGS